MELHLVHIKKNYMNDVAKALSNPDGLAVVGIMFVVGKNGSDFEPFQPIVDAANAIHEDQALEVSAEISLNKFLREVGPAYYTYDGSLTTPTCNEVVSWHVMDKTIAMSEDQINAFRYLNYPDDSPMVDNFRPPQPLNNRIVKRVTVAPADPAV
jgi:carbonic anhydrase